jgi:putative restriction endonuclease
MSQAQQPGNQRNLAYYRQRFTELNVSSNRKRGEAHYKPILLLSVIDLIAQGLIQENRIPVSDELIDTFNNYWNILASGSSYKGGLHYPFIHLQSDGFWHLVFKPDFNGLQPKTTNKLKKAVEYAYLDDKLFDLLQDQNLRQELIDTIIAVWFSANQKKLEDILTINQDFQNITRFELETQKREPKFVLRKSIVRNAVFRKAIVHVYDYKCAFCRLKVIRAFTQNIVDGAHIKPFAEFYDNSAGNGISLCKNHHWAFDNGWFCVGDDYKIIVASDLQEESPHARPMRDFHGETILLPSSEEYFPSLEALQWHRKTWLQA